MERIETADCNTEKSDSKNRINSDDCYFLNTLINLNTFFNTFSAGFKSAG